jgi:2-polyprenyl-3-methyl-5-hydroxy-6-metoxy-1,4-benzoquinol methylase
MIRQPESELMEDEESVLAYAQANFDEPHEMFLDLMESRIGKPALQELVLDLGCGAGDIIRRWNKRYDGENKLTGLDASKAMLRLAKSTCSSTNIKWVQSYLPNIPEMVNADRIICNSLLHHLNTPSQLWTALKKEKFLGCSFFLMDLLRPATDQICLDIVNQYAKGEPEIHKQDFLNSLKAAYRPEEVFEQITEANLEVNFHIEVISNRHLIVYGNIL